MWYLGFIQWLSVCQAVQLHVGYAPHRTIKAAGFTQVLMKAQIIKLLDNVCHINQCPCVSGLFVCHSHGTISSENC